MKSEETPRRNQKSCIEYGQTMQWPKRKKITTYQTTRTPLKHGGELRFPGRVCSSCSTCCTRRVTLVRRPMISLKSVKDQIMITTNGTYQWSFLTQILGNGATVKLSKR